MTLELCGALQPFRGLPSACKGSPELSGDLQVRPEPSGAPWMPPKLSGSVGLSWARSGALRSPPSTLQSPRQ
eukprot:12616713-Alexandrium_andersonii.AAC.1